MGPPLRRESPCLLSFCGFENFQVVDVFSSQWVPSRIGTGRPGWEVNLWKTPDPQIQLLLNGGLFCFAICIFIHYIYIFLNINTGVNSYYFVLVAETSICKPSSESPSPRDYDWLCRIYIYIYLYLYICIHIQYMIYNTIPGWYAWNGKMLTSKNQSNHQCNTTKLQLVMPNFASRWWCWSSYSRLRNCWSFTSKVPWFYGKTRARAELKCPCFFLGGYTFM